MTVRVNRSQSVPSIVNVLKMVRQLYRYATVNFSLSSTIGRIFQSSYCGQPRVNKNSSVSSLGVVSKGGRAMGLPFLMFIVRYPMPGTKILI